jgi:3'(2'), 5'-bisphosphate nucleotidase
MSNGASYEAERAVAVRAVEKASRLCRAVQAHLVSDESMSKKDKSPVTVADFGAQAVVTHVLRGEFPDVPMVGEEDAAELREPANATLCDKVVANVNGIEPDLGADEILDLIDFGTYAGGPTGRHWTLDPIDGTKGFLRLDQYAVALALIEDGEVVLGVLGCPNLPRDAADPDGEKGCLFVAVKGEGASMRGIDEPSESRVRVTDIRDPADASFCESVEAAHSSQSDAARVAELLGIHTPPYRIDSQCKYAAVGRGDASIYLRLPTKKGYEEKIWDHAAGVIVIREAGGCVTDTRGDELDFSLGRTLRDNLGVVVTNGHLHDRVVLAVREVLGH